VQQRDGGMLVPLVTLLFPAALQLAAAAAPSLRGYGLNGGLKLPTKRSKTNAKSGSDTCYNS
jgi:hypothetical protein